MTAPLPAPLPAPWLLAGLLAACGGAGEQAGAPLDAPRLQVSVADKQVAEEAPITLTVRLAAPAGWSAELAPPAAEGLDATLVEEGGPVQIPGGSQTTRTWELSGPAGSYVVQPASGTAVGPDGTATELQAAPVFVDIGVRGPLAEDLAGFESAPPPAPTPWGLYAAAGAGALALAGAVAGGLWWARRRPTPAPLPDPPHVLARRAWAEVRGRAAAAGGDLDDHAQAVALSRVLRDYLEAITGWPAPRRTGPEILRYLEEERVAGAAARAHAGRILSATDRLKFAREGGGAEFFARLDEDFDHVVEATRPAFSGPADAPSDAPSGGEA